MSVGPRLPRIQLADNGKAVVSGDYHWLPGSIPKNLAQLRSLLQPGDTCLFLGDLFEVWYENRSGMVDGYAEHLDILQSWSNEGIKLHLLVGNRDFLASRQLQKHTGLTIHPGPVLLSCAGHQLLAIHGDELLPDDLSYQRFKKWVRHPLVKGLLGHLPLAWLKRLSGDMRRHSQHKLKSLPGQHFQPKLDLLKPLLKACEPDQIIAGHLHVDRTLREPDLPPCTILPDSRPEALAYRIFNRNGLSQLSIST